MRKEIRDFVNAESQPNQRDCKDDPREKMWAICDIYQHQRANQLTLRNDICDLLTERDLHQTPNNPISFLGLNTLQTESDHKFALFDINTAIGYLIITAHKWGIDFTKSDIQKFENVNYGDISLGEFIRFVYGTAQTPYDKLNDPQNVIKSLEILKDICGSMEENNDDNERQIEDDTPVNDTTAKKSTSKKQTKNNAGRSKALPFKKYFLPGIDADLILPILHEFMNGKKGKGLAKYVVAITNFWIEEPGHRSVCKEFEASESAYKLAIDKHYGRNSFIDKRKPFPEDELTEIRKRIEARIKQVKEEKTNK